MTACHGLIVAHSSILLHIRPDLEKVSPANKRYKANGQQQFSPAKRRQTPSRRSPETACSLNFDLDVCCTDIQIPPGSELSSDTKYKKFYISTQANWLVLRTRDLYSITCRDANPLQTSLLRSPFCAPGLQDGHLLSRCRPAPWAWQLYRMLLDGLRNRPI